MDFLKKINSNVRSYVIAEGFYYAGYSVINAFLSIIIVSKIAGGRLDIVGYVIAYYMLVRAMTEIPISSLTKRLSVLSKRNLVGCAYIVYGILIFLLGQSTQLWHIFLIQTLLSLLDAAAYPIKWAIFTRVVDHDNEELEWGLEDLASTILPAFFTALAGIVSSVFGIEYAFLLFSSLLVASGFMFFLIKPVRL